VRFRLLCLVFGFAGQVEEAFAIVNGLVQFALVLINHANLLVALGQLLGQVRAARHFFALLKELKRKTVLVLFDVLVRDLLVHTHEIS